MFDVFNYILYCNDMILNDTFSIWYCAWLTILRTSWTCLVTIIFNMHTLYVCSPILHITVIIVASVALDFAHGRHRPQCRLDTLFVEVLGEVYQ